MERALLRLFHDFYPRNMTLDNIKKIISEKDVGETLQKLVDNFIISEVTDGVYVLSERYLYGWVCEF